MIQMLLFLSTAFTLTNRVAAVTEYKNWAFHFPAGSNMGIFIALAVPIEDPRENVFLAYNIEANYLLPGNQSETVEFPPLVTDEENRSYNQIDRIKIYKAIEMKLKTFGYPGKPCLLRTICEMSASTFLHSGIFGDLLHIIFTPSSSKNNNLPLDYVKAEEYGQLIPDCKKYNKKCLANFSDPIYWFKNII